MYTSYNEACGRDCSDLMTDLELCEKAGMDYKMCIRDRERTWDFKEQEIRWIEKKGAAHRITAVSYTHLQTEDFGKYLAEYLQTDGAQGILSQYTGGIFQVSQDVEITQEQIAKLSKELTDGYSTYAAENHFPDPAMICLLYTSRCV